LLNQALNRAPASEPTATPKPFPEPQWHNCELTDEQYKSFG